MTYLHYRNLLANDGARAYLAKPYGLELLFILQQCEDDGADNGIEDSYDLLSCHKPRRAAFSSFIQALETDGHIIKTVSVKKASKSTLRMSVEVGKAFRAFKAS